MALSGDVVGTGWYVSPLGCSDAPWILTATTGRQCPRLPPALPARPEPGSPRPLKGGSPSQRQLGATLTVSPVPAVRLHDSISEEGFHYLVFDL